LATREVLFHAARYSLALATSRSVSFW